MKWGEREKSCLLYDTKTSLISNNSYEIFTTHFPNESRAAATYKIEPVATLVINS